MKTLTQRIDRALGTLASEPAITLTQAVDAVLADGLPMGLRRDDLRLLVKLRFEGEPVLEGVAGAMQIACARVREARMPLPDREELCELAMSAHPGASVQEVEDGLHTFAEHQQAQAARFAARAGMLRLELIRRRAAQ
jgi:hypothetical protein